MTGLLRSSFSIASGGNNQAADGFGDWRRKSDRRQTVSCDNYRRPDSTVDAAAAAATDPQIISLVRALAKSFVREQESRNMKQEWVIERILPSLSIWRLPLQEEFPHGPAAWIKASRTVVGDSSVDEIVDLLSGQGDLESVGSNRPTDISRTQSLKSLYGAAFSRGKIVRPVNIPRAAADRKDTERRASELDYSGEETLNIVLDSFASKQGGFDIEAIEYTLKFPEQDHLMDLVSNFRQPTFRLAAVKLLHTIDRTLDDGLAREIETARDGGRDRPKRPVLPVKLTGFLVYEAFTHQSLSAQKTTRHSQGKSASKGSKHLSDQPNQQHSSTQSWGARDSDQRRWRVDFVGGIGGDRLDVVAFDQISCLMLGLTNLQHALEVQRLSAKLSPISSWIRDQDRVCCFLCLKRFNSLRRKHHCRSCGEVIVHPKISSSTC